MALILPQTTMDESKIYQKYLNYVAIESYVKVEQFKGYNRKIKFAENTVYLLQPEVIQRITEKKANIIKNQYLIAHGVKTETNNKRIKRQDEEDKRKRIMFGIRINIKKRDFPAKIGMCQYQYNKYIIIDKQ